MKHYIICKILILRTLNGSHRVSTKISLKNSNVFVKRIGVCLSILLGFLGKFQVPSSLLASRPISSSMQPISSLMMLISCYTS